MHPAALVCSRSHLFVLKPGVENERQGRPASDCASEGKIGLLVPAPATDAQPLLHGEAVRRLPFVFSCPLAVQATSCHTSFGPCSVDQPALCPCNRGCTRAHPCSPWFLPSLSVPRKGSKRLFSFLFWTRSPFPWPGVVVQHQGRLLLRSCSLGCVCHSPSRQERVLR